MQIGDDLTKARRFVDAAQAGLARINAGHDASPVLSAIHKDALEMRARAVARSAEGAVTDMQSPERFKSHIFSLTQLLGQYTEGLDEIAPVQEGAAGMDNRSVLEVTKDTLAPLIRFAPAPEQQAALSFLAEFEPQIAGEPEILSGVQMETLMPAVTEHILSEARHAGKSVSVSYAVGDISLPEDIAPDIQDFLTELSCRLVADNLTPADLVPSGVINITAKQEDTRLELFVQCSGQSSAEVPLSLPSLSPMIARSGIFSIEQVGGNTLARLINVDLSKAANWGAVEQPGISLQEALA